MITYARHYKPRLIFFFTQFSLQLRLILQTIYVLKTEILHFLSLKSAVYTREQLLIKSGLWWRVYSSFSNNFYFYVVNAVETVKGLKLFKKYGIRHKQDQSISISVMGRKFFTLSPSSKNCAKSLCSVYSL